jgi:hypothetical protein
MRVLPVTTELNSSTINNSSNSSSSNTSTNNSNSSNNSNNSNSSSDNSASSATSSVDSPQAVPQQQQQQKQRIPCCEPMYRVLQHLYEAARVGVISRQGDAELCAVYVLLAFEPTTPQVMMQLLQFFNVCTITHENFRYAQEYICY